MQSTRTILLRKLAAWTQNGRRGRGGGTWMLEQRQPRGTPSPAREVTK